MEHNDTSEKRYRMPRKPRMPRMPARLQNKPRYVRPIVCYHEFLFIPARGLIRVPEDFEAFRVNDYFWGFLDQGYKIMRQNRHWTLWKITNEDWYQAYRNWSLCNSAPRYCITLLWDETTEGVPGDGYAAVEGDNPLGCDAIWLADRASLRSFFEVFPFPLLSKDQDHFDHYEVVENLLNLCSHVFDPPRPLDYLYRFWPEASMEERQQFLQWILHQREQHYANYPATL